MNQKIYLQSEQGNNEALPHITTPDQAHHFMQAVNDIIESILPLFAEAIKSPKTKPTTKIELKFQAQSIIKDTLEDIAAKNLHSLQLHFRNKAQKLGLI